MNMDQPDQLIMLKNLDLHAINFNMPLSLATNTSVNKSNIVTEYNDIHDPVSCLPVLQNIILPTMSKNMSTHEKIY